MVRARLDDGDAVVADADSRLPQRPGGRLRRDDRTRRLPGDPPERPLVPAATPRREALRHDPPGEVVHGDGQRRRARREGERHSVHERGLAPDPPEPGTPGAHQGHGGPNGGLNGEPEGVEGIRQGGRTGRVESAARPLGAGEGRETGDEPAR